MKLPVLRDYTHAAQVFATARSKPAGKPLHQGYRLFADGDDYVFRAVNRFRASGDIFRIKPDNTVVFTASDDTFRRNAASLGIVIPRLLPLASSRYATGLYRIGTNRGRENMPYWEFWSWLRKEAPTYFQGISFDLASGECLNARPDPLKTINKDKRKVWLADLRSAKRVLKTMAKTGALEAYVEEYESQRHGPMHRRTSHTATLKDVYERVKARNYDAMMMQLVIDHSYGVTITNFCHGIDRMFNYYSVPLRRLYGVFEEGGDEAGDEQKG